MLSNFIGNYTPNVISLFPPANASLFPNKCSINLNVIDIQRTRKVYASKKDSWFQDQIQLLATPYHGTANTGT